MFCFDLFLFFENVCDRRRSATILREVEDMSFHIGSIRYHSLLGNDEVIEGVEIVIESIALDEFFLLEFPFVHCLEES